MPIRSGSVLEDMFHLRLTKCTLWVSPHGETVVYYRHSLQSVSLYCQSEILLIVNNRKQGALAQVLILRISLFGSVKTAIRSDTQRPLRNVLCR